jgi:hypothetical protein
MNARGRGTRLAYLCPSGDAASRWEIEPTLTRLDTVSEMPLSEISVRVIRAVHI